jgi:hypothetical protein
MRDIFVSEPAEGAIVNDWRFETLMLDIQNSKGENFHFEIKPGERLADISRNSNLPWGTVAVEMHIPLLRGVK